MACLGAAAVLWWADAASCRSELHATASVFGVAIRRGEVSLARASRPVRRALVEQSCGGCETTWAWEWRLARSESRDVGASIPQTICGPFDLPANPAAIWLAKKASEPRTVSFPSYVPAVVLTALGLGGWAVPRVARRRRPPACESCGYALAGLRDPVCPECGEACHPGLAAS